MNVPHMADNKHILKAANPKHADEASKLIYSTGDYLFDHVFGEDVKGTHKMLAHMFSKRRGIFSHKFATMAEIDGRPVGLELGYSRTEYFKHYILNFFQTLSYYKSLALAKMFKRSLDIEKISALIPKKHYYIAHLAVDPTHHRSGIGSNLIANACEKAKRAGKTACSLDVSENNEKAIKFYEKQGFRRVKTLENEKLKKRFNLHGRIRMEKPLD